MPADEDAARRRRRHDPGAVGPTRCARLPTVLDEVHAGLVYFAATLHRVVPELYRELEAAVEGGHPGEEIAVPPLLTFGSWMGGDRDGNPNVTAAVTAEALDMMRRNPRHLLESRIELLAQRVSMTDRLVGRVGELADALAAFAELFPEDAAGAAQRRGALPPLLLADRAARAGDAGAASTEGYAAAAELLADLRLAQRLLRDGQGQFVATASSTTRSGRSRLRLPLRPPRRPRARAGARRGARRGALHAGRARGPSLPRADGVALLAREIAQRRPLIPSELAGSAAATQEVVETFRALRRPLRGRHAGAVQS